MLKCAVPLLPALHDANNSLPPSPNPPSSIHHDPLQLNRIVMSALFCVPLALIALYESGSIGKKNQWMKDWLAGPDAIDDESPQVSYRVLHSSDCWF